MTTKNLVAVASSIILGASLMIAPAAPAQAQAKSVTPKATQSVTSINVVTTLTSTSKVGSQPTVKAIWVPKWKTKGIRPSTWKGKGYDPRWENVRKCIVKRESHGVYTVKNRYSSAMGAYQFLDKSWRVPLAKKLKKNNLKHVPIRRWSVFDQDHAFWVAFNHGKGKRHWRGGSYQCW